MWPGATVHGMTVAHAKMSPFSGFATTGDSDESPDNTASQFLLFRGLEPGVTEDLLARGVAKLYKSKPVEATISDNGKRKIASTSNDASLGAKEGSLRRVLLIRDRRSNESWKYGFAEFNTVEDAQAAMSKYKASDRFTISSKPVVISYIHAGVFVPVLHAVDPEAEKFTFSPLSNTSVKLMYWDEAGYACELITVTPKKLSASKRKETEHAKAAAAAAHEGLVPAGKEQDPKSKKRKAEKDLLNPKKIAVAPHLQFWNNRHAELHGLPSNDGEDPSKKPLLPCESQSPGKVSEEPSQSFADLERKCCLLCSRQFKSEAEVTKHERASQLHKDNMKKEDLVAKALVKLSKLSTLDADSSAYRDRAKERRQAFSQPKQPVAQNGRLSKDRKSPAKEEPESVLAPSKGAALLGKMGWSAGEGLGALGTGRKEAITTDLYSKGVGLGAEGGKLGDAIEEAGRQTKSTYADFLSKTKEKAKERYKSLG